MTVTVTPALAPQTALVLNHLRAHGSLTQRSALIDLGVAALPRRIADLKEAGYPINTTRMKNKITGQRFVRYALGNMLPAVQGAVLPATI